MAKYWKYGQSAVDTVFHSTFYLYIYVTVNTRHSDKGIKRSGIDWNDPVPSGNEATSVNACDWATTSTATTHHWW